MSLFAMLYDRSMAQVEEACLRDWRRTLLQDVAGDVLEVGAGTGANLPLYPATVRRLVLAEPAGAMRARLEKKLAAQQSPCRASSCETSDAALPALPYADASFDVVVATLVLCSVAEPIAALAELRRVLRPGGRFVFLEHVAAEPSSSRYVWQRRVEPLWKHLAEGCRLTRRTEQAILDAGFTVEGVQRESMRHAFPLVRPTIRGVATKT